jgi:hypothetical protein
MPHFLLSDGRFFATRTMEDVLFPEKSEQFAFQFTSKITSTSKLETAHTTNFVCCCSLNSFATPFTVILITNRDHV